MRRLVWAGYGMAGVIGVGYTIAYVRLPDVASAQGSASPVTVGWRATEPPEARVWEVFVDDTNALGDEAADVTSRFRLAGTFFLEDKTNQAAGQRCAVLDDRQQGRQRLVREGETVDEHLVVRIDPGEVALRRQGTDVVLRLEFLPPSSGETAEATQPMAEELAWDQRVIEETAFGKRIADNRWIMQRSELLRYRQELLDDPERLAKLFMSMKAEREQGRIEGYRLELEGEAAFYAAIGLQEGDVVRKTNSMKMSKRSRAEYFIREFVNNRLNVVVLDIERDNEPMKLIYYIR